MLEQMSHQKIEVTEDNVIFVNGFQRGGTNILVNLIASHPEVGWVTETHQIFYGNKGSSPIDKWGKRMLYAPVVLATRQHIFWINKLDERKPLSKPFASYVDWRMKSSAKEKINKNYANVNQTNGRDRAKVVPLFKNVNGVVLASDLFSNIYPKSRFIGLVRDGLALCEGFIRRGWTAERFGKMYARVCNQMIEDANRMPDYHLMRFEDILVDPKTAIEEAYGWLGLDVLPGMKYRLQSKRSMDKNGQRSYLFGGNKDREVFWFSMEELKVRLRPDVNQNQIAQLSEQDKEICLNFVREPMEYLGYL
jgi:hypothetical protein